MRKILSILDAYVSEFYRGLVTLSGLPQSNS